MPKKQLLFRICGEVGSFLYKLLRDLKNFYLSFELVVVPFLAFLIVGLGVYTFVRALANAAPWLLLFIFVRVVAITAIPKGVAKDAQ